MLDKEYYYIDKEFAYLKKHPEWSAMMYTCLFMIMTTVLATPILLIRHNYIPFIMTFISWCVVRILNFTIFKTQITEYKAIRRNK